jgi:hypothetical protein
VLLLFGVEDFLGGGCKILYMDSRWVAMAF